MASAVNDAVAFTIEEQTGDKRRLVLTERALPYRPIEFSGDQAAEFTRYPGNPVRTIQVFGPEEEPTEVAGYWKDRFLGTQPSDTSQRAIAYFEQQGQQTLLQTAVDLAHLVDDIRRKGQVVLVQWGHIVRKGLLKTFRQKWHNVHDVEWTLRFEWMSQNDPEVPAVIAKDTDYANTIGSMLAKLQDMSDTILGSLNSNIVGNTIFQYQQYLATLQGLVQEFADTVSSAQSTTLTISDQLRRLSGILNDISAAAVSSMAAVTAAPAITIAVADPTGAFEGPELAAEFVDRDFWADLRDLQYLALNAQTNILKSINPDIIAAFTAKGSTDLRDVSTQFYDIPDEWRSLLVFNGLSDSRLSAGQTIFVPKLLRPLDGTQ